MTTEATDAPKAERLYRRALDIREEHANGYWSPILRHLALRGHTGAMIDLASWFSNDNGPTSLGSAADAFSAAGLYRRAYRKGDPRAAQHMAMSCFNRRDMKGYRHWLGLGARAGDTGAAAERRYFETRLSHRSARDIGRGRPRQKRDGLS